MSDLTDISNLTFYNSAMITIIAGGFLWMFKQIVRFGCFITEQKQKEIDKEKYEKENS